MRKKITEEIIEISGINTNPFRRYVGKIPLNELIDVLYNEKNKSEQRGYYNLNLSIRENSGIIDITLYGDRGLTNKEKENDEIIDVILRRKEKTSKGLSRDDLLNKIK